MLLCFCVKGLGKVTSVECGNETTIVCVSPSYSSTLDLEDAFLKAVVAQPDQANILREYSVYFEVYDKHSKGERIGSSRRDHSVCPLDMGTTLCEVCIFKSERARIESRRALEDAKLERKKQKRLAKSENFFDSLGFGKFGEKSEILEDGQSEDNELLNRPRSRESGENETISITQRIKQWFEKKESILALPEKRLVKRLQRDTSG